MKNSSLNVYFSFKIPKENKLPFKQNNDTSFKVIQENN